MGVIKNKFGKISELVFYITTTGLIAEPKGGTAWVAIAKQLQLSQWDATEGGNYFTIKITYIDFLSNGRVQHRQSLCPRGLRFPQETKAVNYFACKMIEEITE